MAENAGRETKFVKWPTAEGTDIRRVVAVMSGKGGVGKSSVTALLAVALTKAGLKVGIMDADITGPTIPQMFGVSAMPEGSKQGMVPPQSSLGIKIMSLQLLLEDEDSPAILRAPVVTGTIKRFWTDVAWGELDCLLVDLPPGTGDVPLSVMQSLPLDGVMMVSSPQKIAAGVVKKALNMTKRMDIPVVGLVENMSYVECGKCGDKMYVFGPSTGGQLADDYGLPFLGAVPLDPLLVELADRGRIEEYDHPVFGAVAQPLTKKNEILR